MANYGSPIPVRPVAGAVGAPGVFTPLSDPAPFFSTSDAAGRRGPSPSRGPGPSQGPPTGGPPGGNPPPPPPPSPSPCPSGGGGSFGGGSGSFGGGSGDAGGTGGGGSCCEVTVEANRQAGGNLLAAGARLRLRRPARAREAKPTASLRSVVSTAAPRAAA
jgi:hypothetical protein